MKPDKYEELDFYVQYLRVHLKDHHFEKKNDSKFIKSRADKALDTYLAEFMDGHPPFICHEKAMRTLLDGLYISRYDVVYHIIEEDCWLRLPPEVWETVAIHLTALPQIDRVFDRYGVNGNFLDRKRYSVLRYEILGAITEILDGYGL